MIRMQLGLITIFGLMGVASVAAQDWKSSIRYLPTRNHEGIEIDAPQGIVLLADPTPDATVLETVTTPAIFHATSYVETGTSRYYLTHEAYDFLMKDEATYWVSVPGTGRADFIAATTPAALIARETRDFFKTGPETADIYEETVNLLPVTDWVDGHRRAEIDFRLPAKISSFQIRDNDEWELELAVFPAFESNTDRIPGAPPEVYGEPYQALITRPVQRSVKVRGRGRPDHLRSVMMEGTVWAVAFSEGRVQELRIGWHDLEPPHEVSRLSPPQFRRDETMAFRFALNRLLADPIQIEVEPDRIVGVDYTDYTQLAELGGAPGEFATYETYLHQLWNLVVGPDGLMTVVAPLTEGRGAAGIIELESLGLGPSFEEELKALGAMAKATTPLLPGPPADGWISINDEDLGEVPIAQRGLETAP